MKPLKTIFIGLLFFAVASIIISYGCKKKTTCANTGTTINIGSTGGGSFSQSVSPTLQCSNTGSGTSTSYNDVLTLDNTNLNFSCSGDPASASYCSGIGGTIMDCGAQTCADFSYSGTPTASTAAHTDGHGYVAKFADGNIVKFLAGAYSNGSASVSYIFLRNSSPPPATTLSAKIDGNTFTPSTVSYSSNQITAVYTSVSVTQQIQLSLQSTAVGTYSIGCNYTYPHGNYSTGTNSTSMTAFYSWGNSTLAPSGTLVITQSSGTSFSGTFNLQCSANAYCGITTAPTADHTITNGSFNIAL